MPCCWRESKQGTQAEASWLQVSGEGTVGVEAKEAKPVATLGGPPSAPAALPCTPVMNHQTSILFLLLLLLLLL
ncbi:unnamed protein product, partial [Musa acuminata subsp. burmannicoides]